MITKIENNNSLSFGQNIPVVPLFKCALGKPNYEEAKILYNSVTSKFPGHQGIMRKALIFAKDIIRKNTQISEFYYNILDKSAEKQNSEIYKFAAKHGITMDLII